MGYGQAQEVIEARTGVRIGRAQLAGDLAAWTGDFYEERARDAEEEEQPDGDVVMMQADGKGIALRPEHRKGGGTGAAHPGIKKMADIVAVADFTPAVREPEDIAAPPARRKAHPGPEARDKWVGTHWQGSGSSVRYDPGSEHELVLLGQGSVSDAGPGTSKVSGSVCGSLRAAWDISRVLITERVRL